MLCPVIFLPVIVFFITIDKLWILFLSLVETLVIVSCGWSGWIFPGSSGLMQIFMNLIGECEFNGCNVSTIIWRNYFDSFTINPKDFDSDPIVSHKSTMERLSKNNYICSSLVNGDPVQIQKWFEEFIFPLKHHMQRTESDVKDIATFSATGRSEEDASTLFFLHPIKIAPINCDILKQVEVRKRKDNRHMTSVYGYKNHPLYFRSKRRASCGDGKPPSRFHPTSDKEKLMISCSYTNIPT